MATTLYHWFDGASFEGTGGRFSDVTNPATGEVTAQLALASAADVDTVVAAAVAAFPGWRIRRWRSGRRCCSRSVSC